MGKITITNSGGITSYARVILSYDRGESSGLLDEHGGNISKETKIIPAINFYTAHLIDKTKVILSEEIFSAKEKDEKKSIEYCISNGQFDIINHGHKIIVEKQIEKSDLSYKDKIIITLSDDSKDNELLHQFIIDAIEFYEEKNTKKIDMLPVFMYKITQCGRGWSLFGYKPLRTFDNIYIDDHDKKKLVSSLDRFTTSEKVFDKFGIPYKLNILLAGVAGMGKTTLAHTIASEYKKKIFIFPISQQVDDMALMEAVEQIESNSIFLCEDIDCIFKDRVERDSGKNRVTLSCILNILDGMLTKKGIITILTTNYIDRLDDALKRPGRIDLILEFKHASNYQIIQMIKNFYPTMIDLPEQFIQKIRKERLNVSMADLQTYFFYVIGFDGDPLSKIDELKKLCDTIGKDNKVVESLYA